MTIAVEDMERARPQASAAGQVNPIIDRTAKHKSVVAPICIMPVPRISLRIRQNFAGSNSRPIRKSIITTPNSAKCMMSLPSCADKIEKERADDDAANEIAQNRAHAQFFSNRYKHDCSGQINQCIM